MCGQDNVRPSTRDNTGLNTKDTHLIPGHKLKFLTPPGIEPGPSGYKTVDSSDHARATDFLILIMHILDSENRKMRNSYSIDLLVSEILIFKLI